MSHGWYGQPDGIGESIMALYRRVEETRPPEEQDDFSVLLESSAERPCFPSPLCETGWHYEKNKETNSWADNDGIWQMRPPEKETHAKK
jgi:hypothetical protein